MIQLLKGSSRILVIMLTCFILSLEFRSIALAEDLSFGHEGLLDDWGKLEENPLKVGEIVETVNDGPRLSSENFAHIWLDVGDHKYCSDYFKKYPGWGDGQRHKRFLFWPSQ